MTCEDMESLLAQRILGPLEATREQAVAEHLGACAGCLDLARELESSGVPDTLLELGATRAADFAEFRTVDPEIYVRGSQVGRGGMGRIVRARDRRLGRAVAIKELIDERLRDRFGREARLTARLQHPAIVSIHEAGRWPGGGSFHAMKYVAGRPLDQVVAGMKPDASM